MKMLFFGLLTFGSTSAFAQMQEVALIGCQSVLEINTFRNIDQTTSDYIVRTRGIRCSPGGRLQCQVDQNNYQDRANQIDIDETTTILPGEAKFFESKLITCR